MCRPRRSFITPPLPTQPPSLAQAHHPGQGRCRGLLAVSPCCHLLQEGHTLDRSLLCRPVSLPTPQGLCASGCPLGHAGSRAPTHTHAQDLRLPASLSSAAAPQWAPLLRSPSHTPKPCFTRLGPEHQPLSTDAGKTPLIPPCGSKPRTHRCPAPGPHPQLLAAPPDAPPPPCPQAR